MISPQFFNQMAAKEKVCKELHQAIADGDMRIVKKKLREGADLTWVNDKGENAFFMAMIHDQFDLFDIYKNHAGLKMLNKNQNSLVECAMLLGHAPEKLDALQYAGAPFLRKTKRNTHHAFHFAAANGCFQYMDYFLQTQDINLTDEWGCTPLHYACEKGHADVVDYLLKHGADPIARDNDNMTPLCHALTKKENDDIIQMLLGLDKVIQTLNRTHVKSTNNTPLMIAVDYGQTKAVIDMIDKGAHVNPFNKDGKQALFIAAERGKADIVDILINAGADVAKATRQRSNKSTILHNVSIVNYKHIVDVLIKEGADVNATDKYGRTPLHYICDFASPEKTRALLAHHPDVNKQDEKGYRALDLALYNGEDDYLVYSSDEIYVALQLLSAGADPNMPKDFKIDHAPLHQAIAHNNDAIVVALLSAGANPNTPTNDEFQKTPLHLAARQDKTALIQPLLTHGADIQICDAEGYDLLHHAIRHNNIPLVKKLVDSQKFDINAQAKNGDTPLHLACYDDSLTIAQILIEAGANIYVTNKNGETPLHKVALNWHGDVLAYLSSKKCPLHINWNIADTKKGNTPLHTAVKECAKLDLTTLLKSGCDPLFENKNNLTPLHYAILSKRVDVALNLIQNIASQEKPMTHLVDGRGNTLLHHTATLDNYQVMAFLAKTGLDIHAQNKFGDTPLHIAARRNNVRLAQWMLKSKQVDPFAKNYKGETPYDITHRHDDAKLRIVIDMLQQERKNTPKQPQPPKPKGDIG